MCIHSPLRASSKASQPNNKSDQKLRRIKQPELLFRPPLFWGIVATHRGTSLAFQARWERPAHDDFRSRLAFAGQNLDQKPTNQYISNFTVKFDGKIKWMKIGILGFQLIAIYNRTITINTVLVHWVWQSKAGILWVYSFQNSNFTK